MSSEELEEAVEEVVDELVGILAEKLDELVHGKLRDVVRRVVERRVRVIEQREAVKMLMEGGWKFESLVLQEFETNPAYVRIPVPTEMIEAVGVSLDERGARVVFTFYKVEGEGVVHLLLCRSALLEYEEVMALGV